MAMKWDWADKQAVALRNTFIIKGATTARIARALRQERAKVVRVVKKAARFDVGPKGFTLDEKGRFISLADILAALKGRG